MSSLTISQAAPTSTTAGFELDFVVTGTLNSGEIAAQIHTRTLDAVRAKIDHWKNKPTSLTGPWDHPQTKKIACVYVRGLKSKQTYPPNPDFNPGNANPSYACPICSRSRNPCIWTIKDRRSRVLPLPMSDRLDGATPETEGYYMRI